MRVISGFLGGRRFQPPAQMPHTRPTTDIAKEGLFNILQHQFPLEGANTLDLFGGTGSISYELASRGASRLTVVEKDPRMAEFIRKNAASFGLNTLQVIRMDVFSFIAQCEEKYDFIFAGPPYALQNIDDLPLRIFEKGLLRTDGWFVLEHTPRNAYEQFAHYATSRNYGTTVFSFFLQKSSSPTEKQGV